MKKSEISLLSVLSLLSLLSISLLPLTSAQSPPVHSNYIAIYDRATTESQGTINKNHHVTIFFQNDSSNIMYWIHFFRKLTGQLNIVYGVGAVVRGQRRTAGSQITVDGLVKLQKERFNETDEYASPNAVTHPLPGADLVSARRYCAWDIGRRGISGTLLYYYVMKIRYFDDDVNVNNYFDDIKNSEGDLFCFNPTLDKDKRFFYWVPQSGNGAGTIPAYKEQVEFIIGRNARLLYYVPCTTPYNMYYAWDDAGKVVECRTCLERWRTADDMISCIPENCNEDN